MDCHLRTDGWNFTLFNQFDTHKQLKVRKKPFGRTTLKIFIQ